MRMAVDYKNACNSLKYTSVPLTDYVVEDVDFAGYEPEHLFFY
jgi:hypothetical protein